MNLVLAELQFLTHLLFSAINLRSIFLFLLELKGKGVVSTVVKKLKLALLHVRDH